MKISWKSVHPFFHKFTNKYKSRKYKKNRSWMQEVNRNILKMFQIVPCLMCKLCWKFHENPLSVSPNIVISHGCPWKHRERNPVLKGFNVTPPKIPVVPVIMPDLSWKFHENPLTCFSPEASYGLRVLSSPASLCVCVCVRQSQVCPDDNLSPVKATITEIGPEVQNTFVKISFIFGVHWPWPWRSIWA